MYQKPMVVPVEQGAEGVYMASGQAGEAKCDSSNIKGGRIT